MHGTFQPARLLSSNCSYCGTAVRRFGHAMPKNVHLRQMARTIDHIIPQHRGGPNHADNLRIACAFCNEARAIVGDCIGALACSQAVVARRRSMADVVAWWRQVRAERVRAVAVLTTTAERWCA